VAEQPKPQQSVQQQIQARVKALQLRHLQQLKRDQDRSRRHPDLFPPKG
jgi:hypothetical protein